MSNSAFAKYLVDDSITLNFRLVISCEGASSLRRNFYDSLSARKRIIVNVACMLNDTTFSDFTFIVGSREFKVHMSILAVSSSVMRKMFTADLEEAKRKQCTVEAITSETFDHMLGCIYKADIPKDLNAVAMPLYEAAHYYEIDSLEEICAQEIQKLVSWQCFRSSRVGSALQLGETEDDFLEDC